MIGLLLFYRTWMRKQSLTSRYALLDNQYRMILYYIVNDNYYTSRKEIIELSNDSEKKVWMDIRVIKKSEKKYRPSQIVEGTISFASIYHKNPLREISEKKLECAI